MTGKLSCHGHGVDHFPSPNVSNLGVNPLKNHSIFTHVFLLFQTNKSPLFCGDVFLISSHDGEIPRVWSLSPNLSWLNPKFSWLNRNCSWVYKSHCFMVKSQFFMVKSHFFMVKSQFFMVSPWFFSPSQPRRVCPNKGHSLETRPTAHGPGSQRTSPGRNWIDSLPMGKKSFKKKHLDFIKFCLVIELL